jgi:nucleoside-diphosphate-sugar epimerase
VSRILITGATGTVGHPIARRLADEGRDVRALVRDVGRATPLLPAGVTPVAGDVGDPSSVREAADGCTTFFHAAGLPEQWRLDSQDFQRVNVEGTRNVVEAALAERCERFVYTSTIDVFAWTPGEPFDESVIDPEPRPTHYERSKQEADRIVTAALDRGLPAVFLHPSGVYGPAPVLAAGLNDLLAQLALRKIPMLLPGGLPVVYADDVAEGHLRAAEQADVGERFILSEAFHSLADVAETVARHAPRAKVPPVMPLRIARGVSAAGERVARLTKRPPLIPRGALHFLESDARPLATRAQARLGWTAKGFDEGVALTLERFRAEGWIDA